MIVEIGGTSVVKYDNFWSYTNCLTPMIIPRFVFTI